MGHGVDEEEPQLSSLGAALASFPWDASFDEMQHAIRTNRAASAYTTLQAAHLQQWLSQAAPGEAVLVVSHDGIAEVGILSLLGDTDVSTFGRGLDYCEGARLELDGDTVRSVRLLRFEGDREVETDPSGA